MTIPDAIHIMERFRIGAIDIHEPTVRAKVARLIAEFPAAEAHERGIWELGSAFTFAHRITAKECATLGLHRYFAGTHLLLLQLHPQLAEMFGIHGEFPVVYSPYDVLHSAYVQGLTGLMAVLPENRRGIDRTVFGIYAGNASTEAISSRSTPEVRLVHFPQALAGGSTWGDTILRQIAEVLFNTDLYSRHDFVVGDQFYGRRPVLQELKSLTENHRVAGVFGLRKTGKTSLLMQLAAEAPAEQCFVYFDLEGSESARLGDPIPKILKNLAIAIRDAVRARGGWVQALSGWIERIENGLEEATLEGFDESLRAVIGRKKNTNIQLVLVLDEIEHLLPFDLDKLEVGPAQDGIARFFGVLRSLWQSQRENFVFVLVGVTAAAFEYAELYGRSNPLFRVAQPIWLSSLSPDDSADLLRSIGARQGMRWDDQACEAGIQLTGGHPPLLRRLGSEVFAGLSLERRETALIGAPLVNAATAGFRSASQNDVTRMIEHMRKFYGDDFDVLDSLVSSSISVDEAMQLVPGSIDRLARLGLITVQDEFWEPTALLSLVPEFATTHRLNGDARHVDSITLISGGESEFVEFKGSFSVDLGGKGIPETKMEWSCLKAVMGFLNGRGGALLIGVADDRRILGLTEDVQRHGGTTDKFIRRVTALLQDYISAGVSSGCALELEAVFGTEDQVLRIDVPAWSEPVFLSKDHSGGGETGKLYVRNNSQTIGLSGSGLLDYSKHHWKS
jgi:hypothetical protein